MKITSLFTLLSFCGLLCLPVMAESQQSLVSDDAKLAFSKTANGNDITETRVNLNGKKAQSQANHGEIPVGVVGIKIDSALGNAIIEEYPPSNLWQLGIRPGDRVFTVEEQMVDYSNFEAKCRGAVGQLRHLTIIHNGQVLNVNVPLIDSRRLVQYNPDYQKSASMTVRW